jgi:flagellar biosynthetic protein FliS
MPLNITNKISKELINLLYNEAILNINKAADQMSKNNMVEVYHYINKVQTILTFLTMHLNPKKANDNLLLILYKYISKQLIKAYFMKSTLLFDEVIDIMRDIKGDLPLGI